MDTYDVIVMGIDPALPRDSVIAAVAQRLSATPAEVSVLVNAAPTALVAGVSELDARRLVTDLRELGVRVKPRAAGQSMPPPSVRPTPRASSPAPAEVESVGETGAPESSGLDLDLPLPPPRAASVAPRSVAPVSARPAPEAAPKLLEVEDKPERPRAFWSALPEAFLVPFRGHAIYGLFGAPLIAVGAMVAGVLGTRISLLGAFVALVLAFAYVGMMLQVSRRCLWATAVGERVPDPLPSEWMSEYMFTGAGVVIAQAVLGGISGWLVFQMVGRGAPELVVDGFLVFVGLFGVIGFALSAANGSATGYLDVLRILRILAKAPLHVLTVALLGALVQGAAIYAAVLQLTAAAAMGGYGTIFLTLGLVGFVITFAATYGAALTATMMGMLFYAKPEVAS